jgi:hypothetical protein
MEIHCAALICFRLCVATESTGQTSLAKSQTRQLKTGRNLPAASCRLQPPGRLRTERVDLPGFQQFVYILPLGERKAKRDIVRIAVAYPIHYIVLLSPITGVEQERRKY